MYIHNIVTESFFIWFNVDQNPRNNVLSSVMPPNGTRSGTGTWTEGTRGETMAFGRVRG